jgi:hypothetical protein
MPPTDALKGKVQALQLSVEGLLKLLKGDPNDRLRFWEILKGITTPAEFRLVTSHLDAMQSMLKQVQASAKAVEQTAAKIKK